MAKKKEIKKIDPRSTFLAAQISAVKKAYNTDNIFTASEHGKTLYGIPFPSLALEYVFSSNVFLMSKLTGLAGQKGSLKSSLGFEILRWFIEWYGLGVLVETENKLSEQYISIIQDYSQYCQVAGVQSTQEAQKLVTFYEEKHKSNKDMRNTPLCIVIDSLTGSEGEKTKEDIASAGHAVKGYSENALLWTTWLRSASAGLTGKPVVLLFTNHLKDKIGGATRPGMPAQKTTPGGSAQDFHATYYLHMSLVGPLKSVSRQGKEVKITAAKNSMGPDKRSLNAEFIWWYKDEDAHTQLSYWDWYATTAKFLVDPKTPSAARSIIGLTCTAKKFSSTTLGFSGLTATEAGWFIENCPMYRRAIQAALNVPLRNVWIDGEINHPDKSDRRITVNLPDGTISDTLKEQLDKFNATSKTAILKPTKMIANNEQDDTPSSDDAEVDIFANED